MDISEKIKTLRKQRGLTLEAVGDRVGVGKSTVRKWENGDIKNMRRDKIALLAEALGVTPGYLMGWEPVGEAQQNADEQTNASQPKGRDGSSESRERSGDEGPAILSSVEYALICEIRDLSEAGRMEVLQFAQFIREKEAKEMAVHED